MQTYAVLFFVLALLSTCIIDNNIQPFVARIGRISLALFGVLFLVTETIYLFTS